MDFTIKEENPAALYIFAHRNSARESLFKWDINIKISIAAIGSVTELCISIKGNDILCWILERARSEPLAIRIFSEVGHEARKMSVEDRFEKSKLGHGINEFKGSKIGNSREADRDWVRFGINSILLLLGVVLAIWGAVRLSGRVAPSGDRVDIGNLNCSDIVTYAKDKKLKLQSVFGAQFELLEVYDLELVSKSNKEIVCHGIVVTTGSRELMALSLFESDEGNIFVAVESLNESE